MILKITIMAVHNGYQASIFRSDHGRLTTRTLPRLYPAELDALTRHAQNWQRWKPR